MGRLTDWLIKRLEQPVSRPVLGPGQAWCNECNRAVPKGKPHASPWGRYTHKAPR